ncbi:hypothetical protein AB0J71_11645 [Nonomuraea sp. NPDC049637]|uniref:hypothetical protein n=1 Tax=Nonomuraea sp. NPDC049637 TaxID=3154356 RepID=UPI00343C3D76
MANVATGGYLIHQDWSGHKVDNMLFQAWTSGPVDLGNRWFFEAPQEKEGYVWFRMRNGRSKKCGVPGGVVHGSYQGVVTKSCSSGDEFLWRAEPQNDAGSNRWRTVKFVSYSTTNAMKPYGNNPDEYIILEDDGYANKYSWSVGG